jgi:hypothetical protein
MLVSFFYVIQLNMGINMFNRKPKVDLFVSIRNKVSIILLKIEKHSRSCPMDDNEKFWENLDKDFADLSSLIREKRSSNRLKFGGPTRMQKIFFILLFFLLVLESFQLYNAYQIKKSIRVIQNFITSR